MSDFEVPEPIICSPFDEPAAHWHIEEGAEPRLESGRRPSVYFRPAEGADPSASGTAGPLRLVELVRPRVKQWRADGYQGCGRTTTELLEYWRRDGR